MNVKDFQRKSLNTNTNYIYYGKKEVSKASQKDSL